MPAPLHQAGSIVVARPAGELYDMVSDVTRMREWSPVCTACWWDEGDSARVGAWFTGRNEMAERRWETRCAVVAADPGREFAFVVSAHGARWGFTFRPVEGGTEVTESWDLPSPAVAALEKQIGADARIQIAQRSELSSDEIAATLAAIKKSAEDDGAG